MNERDAIYLEHILDAIERIERYTAEGRAVFMVDDKTQSAVMRQLEIIGEAAKQMSKTLTAAEPAVPGAISQAHATS